MFKDYVRCFECELCRVWRSAGFRAKEYMFCSERSVEGCNYRVSRNDGCTFGIKGEPEYISNHPDVTIAGFECVYGCDGYE